MHVSIASLVWAPSSPFPKDKDTRNFIDGLANPMHLHRIRLRRFHSSACALRTGWCRFQSAPPHKLTVRSALEPAGRFVTAKGRSWLWMVPAIGLANGRNQHKAVIQEAE